MRKSRNYFRARDLSGRSRPGVRRLTGHATSYIPDRFATTTATRGREGREGRGRRGERQERAAREGTKRQKVASFSPVLWTRN